MKRRLFMLTALVMACNTPPATTIKAGDPAPDLTMKLHDGKKVTLSSMRGKWVLVYFYPKDDTPG